MKEIIHKFRVSNLWEIKFGSILRTRRREVGTET
jgi:hypothetical protein